MERLVLVERKLGDVVGVAAGLVRVAAVGEEKLHRLPERHGIGIGEDTLHLGVDDAVADEPALVVELVVPAFLVERHSVLDGERMEHCVHIDVDQVQKIRAVAGRDGIDCLVRIGHRVQERRERALQQVHERLLDGVLPRTAQHRVLHDVRDASFVFRNRLERDGECLVVIIALQPDELCAVLFVRHAPKAARHLGEFG